MKPHLSPAHDFEFATPRMRLTFLGATRTVTGSKYLLEAAGRRVLFDCGLFQGVKELRLRNWSPLPVEPAAIDAVVLTHAHLDHSGYLPLLVRNGFVGPVYCTPATLDLCAILLPDSGHLQEEEAERANRYGYTKHKPALPLYSRADAETAVGRLQAIAYGESFDLSDGITARFDNAGHILGAAFVTVRCNGRTIVFSGDLGRPSDPVLFPPTALQQADYLLVESTYGDRDHLDTDPGIALAEVVRRTVARGGTVVIPANAVGRSQLVLHHLHRLKGERRIPDLPVFLDSPMSADVTDLFAKHDGIHRLSVEQCRAVFGAVHIANTVEESKQIDRSDLPKIVISASGMATGGRVLYHLKRFATERKNVVLFVGYQAAGTRGASLLSGARELKIHGGMVSVEAEVMALDGLSAHADYAEILDWLADFERPPRRTFIVHGESDAAAALHARIRARLGWDCAIPEYRQAVEVE
jgi:metallo-beta-lactamase family protein